MPKLVLLDGHSLAYRAFYALPSDLATSQGQVTNAVYGFTSMLIRLLGDEAPDAVAVAWDLKGGTFRNQQYPEYKAQREAPPDIFRSQLPLIEKVATALKIHQFSVPGFEADDVIATIAERAKAAGMDVLVVTGGLGPTEDDRTRGALASARGVGLERSEEAERAILEFFSSRGRTASPSNMRQALVPIGAESVPNDFGTAPAVWWRRGPRVWIALPGVPDEMRSIWDARIEEKLRAQDRAVAARDQVRLAKLTCRPNPPAWVSPKNRSGTPSPSTSPGPAARR